MPAKISTKIGFLFTLICLLTACGFHPRGEMQLAPRLHRLYLQAVDPYSYLVRALREYLKVSEVQLTQTPQEAETLLVILNDIPIQQLLSVSGTQQTRQYRLAVTVVFQIQDNKGHIILGPQSLTEERLITIQSDQILGSSNEANLFYQQMRRALAYAIMNRIASREVTRLVDTAFTQPAPKPS